MRQTEPVQQPALFKEETGLPPIPARPAGVFVQDADPFDADPFADPDSTLENKPPPGEPHRVLAPSLVLPPIPALDPFADPLVLVSTSHDGDGLSRLSAGSIYDESIARASMSSNNVSFTHFLDPWNDSLTSFFLAGRVCLVSAVSEVSPACGKESGS
jgi:hypothetical protein